MDAAADLLRDIRGPVALDGQPPFLWTVILLILAAVAWWAWRQQARRPVAAAAVTSPHDLLSALLREYHRGTCAGAHFLMRLDTLLRQAIAAQTGIPAHRFSAQELLEAVDDPSGPPDMQALSSLLSLLDRVKFANYAPTGRETDWAADTVLPLLAALAPRAPA